ncbi:MAG: hypothetical protein MUP14_01670 [Dehalococcoidia bacterium]|nr:hypothetical protein [Dehalococcoidia bacterium]
MRISRKLSLLLVAAIALLAIAGGALLLQHSGQAEAGIIAGDSLSCPAAGDALVVAPESAGTSLATTDTAALSAQCYFVGISILEGGCGGEDLWIMRYLCYSPGKGWYYSNYGYCV